MKRPPVDPLLAAVLIVSAFARAPAFVWGLPNVEGWDDDGVAPRDVLTGVIETYSPGSFYIYPPLELLLVTLLTLPVTLVRLAGLTSLKPDAIVRAFVEPGAMTGYAVAARMLSLAFGCATLVALFDGTRRLAGPVAARVAAALAACHVTFAYYMHTSNLDGPLLFWCVLTWRELVRVLQGEGARWRFAAFAAAAALATKDQGYAVLALPLAFAVVGAVARAPAGEKTALALRIAREAGVAIALLLFVDGAFVNPSGFAARIAKLRGSASQDYRDYVPGLFGSYAILRDAVLAFPRFLPAEVGVMGLVGVGVTLARIRRGGVEAMPALLAPLASLSFFVFFNLVARRTQERFLLPSSFFLVVPASEAFVALVWRRAPLRRLGSVALALTLGRGAYGILALESSFLHDPREAVERYLLAHAAPGERVEVYGNNVYLPRVPQHLVGERVGPSPARSRPYVPSLREVEDAYEHLDERRPEWVVVPEAWAWQWLLDPLDERTGRWSAPVHWESLNRHETQRFFRDLVAGRLGYEPVDAGVPHAFCAHVGMHNSLNRRVYLLRRR